MAKGQWISDYKRTLNKWIIGDTALFELQEND
jgi:hypothetical protein